MWRPTKITTKITQPLIAQVKERTLPEIARMDVGAKRADVETVRRQKSVSDQERYNRQVALIKADFHQKMAKQIDHVHPMGGDLTDAKFDRYMREYYFSVDGIDFRAIVDGYSNDEYVSLQAEKMIPKGIGVTDKEWVFIRRPADLVDEGIVT